MVRISGAFVDTSRLDNTGGVERVASKMDFSRPRDRAAHESGFAFGPVWARLGLRSSSRTAICPGSARKRHPWGCRAGRNLLNGREFDAHFAEIAVIYGKFICISQLQM